MFGVVPKPVWSRLVTPDEMNRIPLAANCLLLERDGERVLVETGYGAKWPDKERRLFDLQERTVLDALAEVDVDPAAINLVLVTHLHFDHAGGLTHLDASGEPTSSFPHARIVVQRTEWDDALADKTTMTRTFLRSHLDPVADQIDCVDGEVEVRPGLTVVPMPGHTWGQHAVRFDDDDGTVCFPADALPTANHVGLAFNMGYDMEPYTNLCSKRALLERAAADRWRLVLAHDPETPVVRVEEDGDKRGCFRLTPA